MKQAASKVTKLEKHPAFTYKGYKTYKTYVFQDKDPVIDELRMVVERSGLSYTFIGELSGVSRATIHNWFYGRTRRPQSATVEAVLRSLGHKRVIKKEPRR